MTLTQQVQIQRLHSYQAGHAVDTVFAGLSAESRRLRFHIPMPRLPTYFRRELTQLDGSSRAAVAAWADGEVVGIARLGRVRGDEAEVAIAVVDSWQSRGIGRLLLRELFTLAWQLGYRRVSANVLAGNAAMLRLLRELLPDARLSYDDGAVDVRSELSGTEWAAIDEPGARIPAQRA